MIFTIDALPDFLYNRSVKAGTNLKILHTSDIHLKTNNDERWHALETILNTGKTRGIDLLAICGDLFDSKAAAEKLHPKIQPLFDSSPFPVVILPGNHDMDAYPDGSYFGDRVSIISDLFDPIQIGDTFIWGFPFSDLRGEEILALLHSCAGKTEAGFNHILLVHGELLDVSGDWENYGEEGDRRYLPVKLKFFKNLPWTYILSGHFHSSFTVRLVREDAYFVYSGSPVSITKKETGERLVNLFEIGSPPEGITLNTAFFHELDIPLDPFRKENPLKLLIQALKNIPEQARLLLRVHGYYDSGRLGLTEEELAAEVKRIASDRSEDIRLEIHNIRELLEDDLFQWFKEKLDALPVDDKRKEKIRDLTLGAMMEIKR